MSGTLANTTTAPDAKEWDNVLIAGLCVDGIGVVACTAMMLSIIIYRQYQSTKDRIIASIGATSLLYLALGSIPERVFILQNGRSKPLPFVLVLLGYSWWWMLLLIETLLLSYSLYVILFVRRRSGDHRGAILRPLNVSLGGEFIILILTTLAGFGVGLITAFEYTEHCSHSYYGVTSDNCVRHFNSVNWAWIAFLSIPLVIQFTLWHQVTEAKQDIERLVSASDLDRSSGMALALERVIGNIIRPLQWYPIIFLLFAALYIVWVVTLYGVAREQKWAREVGPITSMCFSLKGISVAIVFFLAQSHDEKELPFWDQLMVYFGCMPSKRKNPYKKFASGLSEELIDDDYNEYTGFSTASAGESSELYGEGSEHDVFASGSSGSHMYSRMHLNSETSVGSGKDSMLLSPGRSL